MLKQQLLDITREDGLMVMLDAVPEEFQGLQNYRAFKETLKKIDEVKIIKTNLPIPTTVYPEDAKQIYDLLLNVNIHLEGVFSSTEISFITQSKTNSYAKSKQLDSVLKSALDVLVPKVLSRESLTNTIALNLVVKLVCWFRLFSSLLETSKHPKLVVECDLKKHEWYFMYLLKLTGFDILVVIPNVKESLGYKLLEAEIKLVNYTVLEAEKVNNQISENKTSVLVPPPVTKVKTKAKEAEEDIQKALYEGSGMFKPWQSSSNKVHISLIDGSICDIETYWNVVSSLRQGFVATSDSVCVPVFFTKIDGAYKKDSDYIELLQRLVANDIKYVFMSQPNAMLSESIIHYSNRIKDAKTSAVTQTLKALQGLITPRGINVEAFKKVPIYKRLVPLRIEMQDNLLLALNDMILGKYDGIFNFRLSTEHKLRLLFNVCLIPASVIDMLQGYDYTGQIPKLIYYLEKSDIFEEDAAVLLWLLHLIGLDVVVLTRSMSSNIENCISIKYINIIRLERCMLDAPVRPATWSDIKSGLLGCFN